MGRVGGGWSGRVRLLGAFRTLTVCSFEQISMQNAIGETFSSSLNDSSKYLAFKLPFKRHGEGGVLR